MIHLKFSFICYNNWLTKKSLFLTHYTHPHNQRVWKQRKIVKVRRNQLQGKGKTKSGKEREKRKRKWIRKSLVTNEKKREGMKQKVQGRKENGEVKRNRNKKMDSSNYFLFLP